MESGREVIIIPCSGIGKPTGTVGRAATYEVVEKLRPASSKTLCLALLVKGDKEALNIVHQHPCITIDGCPLECARKNVELAGGRLACGMKVTDVYKDHKELKPETVLDIGEPGRKLARLLAEMVAREVDDIIAKRRAEKNG